MGRLRDGVNHTDVVLSALLVGVIVLDYAEPLNRVTGVDVTDYYAAGTDLSKEPASESPTAVHRSPLLSGEQGRATPPPAGGNDRMLRS